MSFVDPPQLIEKPMTSMVVMRAVFQHLEQLGIDPLAHQDLSRMPRYPGRSHLGVVVAGPTMDFLAQTPLIPDEAGFLLDISESLFNRMDVAPFVEQLDPDRQILTSFKSLSRLIAHFSVNIQFWFDYDHDYYWLCRNFRRHVHWRMSEPSGVALMMHLLQKGLGEEGGPSAVRIRSEKGDTLRNSPCFDGIKVITGASSAGIGFRRSQFNVSQAELEVLKRFRSKSPPLADLKKVIWAYVCDPEFDLTDLAYILEQPESLIVQIVNQNGYSFESLLSESRFELAEQLISRRKIPVEQIIRDVGFVDPHPFEKKFPGI